MSKDVITVLELYHKNIAVKVKMNVEDNLDSDNFYDFWQLSGCDVVLRRNLGHNSKIITYMSWLNVLKNNMSVIICFIYCGAL